MINQTKQLHIPQHSLFKDVFFYFVALGIDFGLIMLPGIVALSALILNYSIETFTILYGFSLIIAVFWFYIIFIKYYKFRINTFRFTSSKIKKNCKFVFISDLHIGKEFAATNKIKLKSLINKINKIEKDFILLGGDLIDYKLEKELLAELSNLRGRKIAVLGNHDCEYLNRRIYTKETPVEIIEFIKSLRIELLTNTGTLVGEDLFIGGILDLYTLNFDIDNSFKESKEDHYKILMSHNPDIILWKDQLEDIDLILSGHNHGAQINFLGLKLPMPTMHNWLTKGMFKISNKSTLLLSQGIGATKVRARIGTDFEICIVKLSPKQQ